ncbi:glutathione S-transferase 1-like [Galleria mellonella]|uniref:Glutathione S-transferase 1-like n=1 Tax=Galleria mellonella TaxID=7137 RepID=A0A6J3BP44_GALME|nr:glutathione S-transferase 1-like [Galleria mellonella]
MSGILYMTEASPPARTVLMLLDILGVKLELREINPVLREQDSPEMKKKNPMKTVPILDEGDFSLADSHAIVLYLLEKYGRPEHKQLYPPDARIRATIHNRMFFDCGILFPRLRAIMAPTYGGRLTELSKYMIINIVDAYEMLEMYLNENKYIAAEHMTIADISVLTTVSSLNGLHPIDEKRFPKLKQWLTTMNEKDFAKKINVPGYKLHVDGLIMLMEFNRENKKSKL